MHKHTQEKRKEKNPAEASSVTWSEMTAGRNTFLKGGRQNGGKEKKKPMWSAQSNTWSWLLIGEAEQEERLPGDRPAASHRPAELCLNYKLETHLSATQRNQRTHVTHTAHNIWKPQPESAPERTHTSYCTPTVILSDCHTSMDGEGETETTETHRNVYAQVQERRLKMENNGGFILEQRL